MHLLAIGGRSPRVYVNRMPMLPDPSSEFDRNASYLFEFKAFETFSSRHMVDIPRLWVKHREANVPIGHSCMAAKSLYAEV